MLPAHLPNANLNTGVFDRDGIYWFTGQNGVHGYVNPKTGKHESWKSPRRGTYGITVTPDERGLVRRARRRPSRQDRQGDRQCRHRRTAQEGRRAAPRLVRFQGYPLGQLLAFRRGGPLRPRDEDLEDVASARQSRQRLLFGPCRRAGQGLADRLHDQRHRPVRSGDGEVREIPEQSARRPGAADARAGRARHGARNPATAGWCSLSIDPCVAGSAPRAVIISRRCSL